MYHENLFTSIMLLVFFICKKNGMNTEKNKSRKIPILNNDYL